MPRPGSRLSLLAQEPLEIAGVVLSGEEGLVLDHAELGAEVPASVIRAQYPRLRQGDGVCEEVGAFRVPTVMAVKAAEMSAAAHMAP